MKLVKAKSSSAEILNHWNNYVSVTTTLNTEDQELLTNEKKYKQHFYLEDVVWRAFPTQKT